MSNKDIEFNIKGKSDGSLESIEKTSSNINSQLAAAARNAEKVSKVQASGTTGSRGVSAAADPMAGKMTGKDYGTAHSMTGGSGASARDFADQSRGLGGLVRLYATYAANLFAVTAAFSALKNAMDTTNMVAGMDQLGTISGVALGSLSKELVKATDGALSLRDAMSATAKVTAAGLSSDSVVKIGKVARGASQALGIDLQDSVSRLSRAVTKLEPELLDELGIFVRIDDVVTKYAASVGKSANSLTDFERRQAFANEVLAQGAKKFGDIKLEANPYDKILASVQNLGQKVLEITNVILTPFINMLSQSPMALGVALASVAAILVKQAVPAIGEFRAGLKATEDAAADFAAKKAKDAVAARQGQFDRITALAEQEADAQIKAVDKAAAKVEEISAKQKTKQGSKALELLDKPAQERTAADYSAAEAEAKAIEKTIAATDKRTKAGKALVAELREELSATNASIAAAKASQAAEENYALAVDKARAALNQKLGALNAVTLAEKASEKAQQQRARSTIVSAAGEMGSLVGIRAAWAGLKEDLASQGKTVYSAPFTAIAGGAAAVTGRLSGLIGAFGVYGQVLAFAGVAISAVNGFMTTSAEETKNFNDSLDALGKTTKTAADNLSYFARQDYNAALPLAAIQSRATALGEVSSALVKNAEDFEKLVSKRGKWDNFWDAVFSVVGSDTKATIAETMSQTIMQSIANMPSSDARDEYEKKLQKILGTDKPVTQHTIEVRIKALGDKEAAKLLLELGQATKAVTDEQKVGAMAAVELDNTFKNLNASFTGLANSLVTSSPFTKFSDDLLKNAAAMTDALKHPTDGFAALVKLVNDNKTMTLLGPESFKAVTSAREEINKISKDIFEANKTLQATKQEKGTMFSETDVGQKRKAIEIARQESIIRDLEVTATKLTTKVIGALSAESVAVAGKALGKEMSAAMDQAGLTIRKAYAGLFSGQAAINEQADIAKRDIEIKKTLIEATLELVRSNFLVAAENKATRAFQMKTKATETLSKKSVTDEQAAEANAQFSEATQLESQAKIEKSILTSKNARKTALDALSGDAQALLAVDPIIKAMEGSQRQLQQLAAESKSVDVQRVLNTAKEQVAVENRNKDNTIKTNQELIKQLDLRDQITGKATEETLTERARLDAANADLEYLKKKDLLNKNIELSTKAAADPKTEKDAAENLRAQIKQDAQTLKLLDTQTKSEKVTAEQTTNLKIQDNKYKDITEKAKRLAEQEDARTVIINDAGKAKLDTAKQITEAEFQLGKISETRKIALDLENQNAGATLDAKQKQIDLDTQRSRLIQDINNREDRVLATTKVGSQAQKDGLALLETEKQQVEALYQTRSTGIATNLAQQTGMAQASAQLLSQQNAINLKLAEQNLYLQNAKNLGDSLRDVFKLLGDELGNVGEQFATIGETLAKSAVEQEQYASDRIKLVAQLNAANKGGTDQEQMAAAKKLNDLDNKNTKDQVKNDMTILSSTKKLFGEKTAAYKILAGMEKAMFIAKLAMDIKSMFFDTSKTATSVANSGVRAGAAGTEAIAQALALPQPMGFIAGAAMAAIVASLLGEAIGPSISGGDFKPTSEQRQKTQGTAMGYDAQGNEVQVRRGVLGDTEAKSESIANSLEIIQANSVDGLTYDNRMLDALKSIQDNTSDASKALYGISGLRSGSLSGVQTGENTSGGFLGIGGLFSSSTNKAITDSGLRLKGTFKSIADAAEGAIKGYEDVQTTRSSSGFFGIGASTSTSNDTILSTLDPKAVKAISGAFKGAENLLLQVADVAGIADSTVSAVLSSINIDEWTSLRGLKGADLEKEINALLGSALDDASLAIFSQFEKFGKMGEGMLETVVRVVDTNTKVNQELKNLGILNQFDTKTTKQKSMEITEALVNGAGGLSQFIEQAEFFRTNFLTASDRLAPTTKAVNTELTRLGISTSISRKDFAALVQSLDVTTVSGRETYQALMDVQTGLDEVRKAEEAIASERKTLEKKMLEMQGDTIALRALELAALDESNQALQTQIWLMEDQQKAGKALKTSIENVNKTYKSQIQGLADYRTNLMSGDKSTLTKTQQYQATRTELGNLLSIINTQASTPEQVDARNTAIGKLTGTTDKWLGLSKELFASGSAYTEDFNTVAGIIESVSGVLQGQLTDSEKQLKQLVDSNTYLQSIDTASKSTAQLLEDYLALGGAPITVTSATGTSSAGGTIQSFAVGSNFIPNDMTAQIHRGERIIPAADNFRLMSKLTNTDEYTRQMVEEIRKLNAKITTLEQTVAQGAVINAQATDRNTEQVTVAITGSSDKAVQVARVQNKAVIK